MTSLRSRLVEAGARAIDAVSQRGRPEGATPPFDETSGNWRDRKHEEAEAALDAFLDTLTENADEWAEETHVPTLVGGDALALLAVLRNS